MSKLYIGSISVSDLHALALTHSAFSKSPKNGKVYADIAIWINDDPDKYGNHVSLSLRSKKSDEHDKTTYIGNAREYSNAPKPSDIPQGDWLDGVPVRASGDKHVHLAVQEDGDGLQF